MGKTAILVDGAFFLKRALKIFGPQEPEELAKKRQQLILDALISNGYITESEANIAYEVKLIYESNEDETNLSTIMYYQDSVIEELKSIKSNVKISVLCPGPFNSNFNKTAGAKNDNKGLSVKKIAKIGIDKTLKNKMIIIPSIKWKLILLISKLLPLKIVISFINKFQDKKRLTKNSQVTKMTF